MLNEKELSFISQSLNLGENQVKTVISLLEEGNTVPFIARYRKERTGNLNETEILNIKDMFEYITELNDRKKTVLKTIEEQGKLTDELKKKIEETFSKTELEDIYLPFKPKRRTKATVGREMGLEPLAEKILQGEGENIENLAKDFVNLEKQVENVEKALEYAGYILAERFGENSSLRKTVREMFWNEGVISVSATKDFEDKRSKYEMYYSYSEKVKTIPSHRILAIRRGEKEKVLRSKIEIDMDKAYERVNSLFFDDKHVYGDFLKKVLYDALKRLVFPSIELDVRMELKKNADLDAIGVFAKNLENLLLMPPAGTIPVLGVDPGYRTGCKIVALSETGKLLENATIYPTKPHEKIEEAKKIALNLIEKYKIKAVAIGNGTASRETRAFFKSIVPDGVIVSVVNEAGASVYSASKAAIEEFPDYDLTVRGAVSIGRRFQDPLSELVKIDPKSIGVGQYQHDVNQTLLKKKLDNVVVSVVNRVGVDLNTASYHLLKYVSGISERVAKNIVEYRDKNGKFADRKQLLEVKGFGDKTFEQSAGFLRIRDGENILDSTGIHPESYFIVEKMAEESGVEIKDLIGNEEILNSLDLKKFETEEFGEFTLNDIVKELLNPGRDPRKDFELFEFAEGIETIEDLSEGMILNGVITNVTKFGAFVDIGVHQDGLVHISELSHSFVKNPEDEVSVGDKVKVKVLKVDNELNRIFLSMKAIKPYPKKNRRVKKAREEKKDKKEILVNKLLKKFGKQ